MENTTPQENTATALPSHEEQVVVDAQKYQETGEKQVVTFFTSSHIAQPAGLKEFFEEKLAHPYNKYCIDCKKNQTTHAVVWLGAFVCEECAN
mmetsp:Transcript_8612/g.13345  ORF Transcript_8612/g.13345 Transcript_8612/m.13345 type:complete len:93 (-) Transcript_8612:688-966(-)